MHFGEKFTQLVKESGKTYQQIATGLGLKSRSSIINYMDYETLENSKMLKRICEFFQVPPDYFSDEKAYNLRQKDLEYKTDKKFIPVMSDETKNAVKVDEMYLSEVCNGNGFAVFADERIERLGFKAGSKIVFSYTATPSGSCLVLVETEGERFFADYKEYGKDRVITLRGSERPPITLNKGTNVKIIAVSLGVVDLRNISPA